MLWKLEVLSGVPPTEGGWNLSAPGDIEYCQHLEVSSPARLALFSSWHTTGHAHCLLCIQPWPFLSDANWPPPKGGLFREIPNMGSVKVDHDVLPDAHGQRIRASEGQTDQHSPSKGSLLSPSWLMMYRGMSLLIPCPSLAWPSAASNR